MKAYTSPELTSYGSISSLTAAIGTSPAQDTDERTNTFGTGSFDICDPDQPDSNCNQ